MWFLIIRKKSVVFSSQDFLYFLLILLLKSSQANIYKQNMEQHLTLHIKCVFISIHIYSLSIHNRFKHWCFAQLPSSLWSQLRIISVMWPPTINPTFELLTWVYWNYLDGTQTPGDLLPWSSQTHLSVGSSAASQHEGHMINTLMTSCFCGLFLLFKLKSTNWALQVQLCLLVFRSEPGNKFDTYVIKRGQIMPITVVSLLLYLYFVAFLCLYEKLVQSRKRSVAVD